MTKTTNKVLILTIRERALVPEIMPESDNKLKQIIVRSINQKVQFSAEEIDKFGIRFQNERIFWNPEAFGKEFQHEFNDAEVNILKEASSNLDKGRKVTQLNLSLVEKIDSL